MQPKFNLTVTLYAKPEKRVELLKLLTSFVDKSRSEQGCVDYHFHISLDVRHVLLLGTGRFRSPHRARLSKGWFAKQGDYLAKPVELRFFEMVSTYDK